MNNPIRTCIVCRKKGDKHEFVRIVKNKNGNISLDKLGKESGRGCYVCASHECLDKLKKSRALNRAYKANFMESVYDDIIREIKNA